jgi:hypothetical protein
MMFALLVVLLVVGLMVLFEERTQAMTPSPQERPDEAKAGGPYRVKWIDGRMAGIEYPTGEFDINITDKRSLGGALNAAFSAGRAVEREECAKVADQYLGAHAVRIAAAIRSRDGA